MAICVRTIQPGETIGTASGAVTATAYLLETTGTPPCAPGSISISEGSPWELSNASGAAIGGAILMVMGMAFVLRMIRKSIESHYPERDDL